VNPPSAQKYCYWTNSKKPKDPDKWLEKAERHDGSWWPEWVKWLKKYGDGTVPARTPGDGKLKPIEDAPGSYVLVKSDG
jgi:polyhydroxyalkanoate synthase